MQRFESPQFGFKTSKVKTHSPKATLSAVIDEHGRTDGRKI